MARKTNTFAVLQFDERLLTFLRAQHSDKGVHVVESVREYGEWTSEADLQKALKEFVKQHRLAAEPVYLVLPRHETTARLLDLPSQEIGELMNMVRLSAEEYVPYPLEDLVIDLAVLERPPDGTSRVLVAFAHRDVVERQARLLREAGIEPERNLLSTTCLASAAMAARRSSDERYALVNLSSSGVEVLVLKGTSIEYGRAVASHRAGPLPDLAREDLVEELAMEIRASLSAHRRESEDGEPVEKIYLCSEWADAAALSEGLAEVMGQECRPADFARTLVTQGEENVSTTPLTLLGAALTAQGRAPHVIDLVPASLMASRAVASRKRILKSAALWALVALLALSAWYGQTAYQRASYAAELEGRAAALRPEAQSVMSKRQQLRILQRQVDPSGSALETLATVTKLAPASGLTISQFTYERGTRITIRGRARTFNEVEKLAADLRESGGPLFADTRRGDIKPVKEQNGEDAVEYSILVPFPTQAGEGDTGAGSAPEGAVAAADTEFELE